MSDWDQEEFPLIEDEAEHIEEIISNNEREIILNAVRIRLLERKVPATKPDEKLAELQRAINNLKVIRTELHDGLEILRERLKELKPKGGKK